VQLALVAATALIGFGILNWYVMTPTCLSEHNTSSSQVFSSFWSLLGGTIILLVIFHFDAIESKPRAILIALLGAGFGWLIGMYISPRNTLERQEFAAYKGALVGILSGYVLGKVQSFINDKFKTPEDFNVRRQAYAGIFVVSALLTIGAIYNVRAYGVNYVKVSIKDFSKLKTVSPSGGKDTNESDEDKIVLCDGKDDPDIVFVAESTISDNSSVTWETTSPDPSNPQKANVSGAFANSQIGVFTLNKGGCEGTTYIVARSNGDPAVSGLYTLKTRKESAASNAATAGSQGSVPNAGTPTSTSAPQRGQPAAPGGTNTSVTTPIPPPPKPVPPAQQPPK
jgi:hypothetical protein